jgi:WD40 repeat protein
MIYDALKAKLLSHVTPSVTGTEEGSPSFEVDWNMKEPKHIIMSSKNNSAYFLEVSDPNTCKQISVKRQFPHPSSVYGVMWDPFNPTRFITGCNDNNVRLFDIST